MAIIGSISTYAPLTSSPIIPPNSKHISEIVDLKTNNRNRGVGESEKLVSNTKAIVTDLNSLTISPVTYLGTELDNIRQIQKYRYQIFWRIKDEHRLS